MKLRYISTKKELEKFIYFSKKIYKDDFNYRDSMSEITRMFLLQKTAYFKHGEIYPFFIERGEELVARAAFIIDYKLKDLLLISFFEAKQEVQNGIEVIINEAKKLAKIKGLRKIIIGLDAHLNYGVGFLASHFNTVPTFGLPYNPEYYLDFFQGLREYNFTSFLIDLANFNLKSEQKIIDRIRKKGFTFRFANFKKLDQEIATYTWLNNLCFQDHLWWANRTFTEDKELFYPFRWFLKEENLIFAEKDGQPIGMILWYPDFNQLVGPGKALGLTSLIKYKLGNKQIDKFKIAEIGICPEYQGTGVILGFFQLLSDVVKTKYKYCEAGWIAEENLKSKGLGLRWQDLGCNEYKKYKAYEVLV